MFGCKSDITSDYKLTLLLLIKHCVLEDLHQETRAQNEQIENEMDKLHSEFAC